MNSGQKWGKNKAKPSCTVSFMHSMALLSIQNKKNISCHYHSSNPPRATGRFQNEIQILYHGLSCITGFHSCQFQVFPLPHSATLVFFYLYSSSTSNMVLQNFPQLSLNISSQKGFMSIQSLTSKVFTSNSLPSYYFFPSPYHNHNYLINYIVFLDVVFLPSQKCKFPKNRGLHSQAPST